MQLNELAPLFKLEERACAGDRIIDDGDEADRCYVLLQGETITLTLALNPNPNPNPNPDPDPNPDPNPDLNPNPNPNPNPHEGVPPGLWH